MKEGLSKQLKFRPNEPPEQREWQEEIARRLGIEHDAEYFKVPVTKPDGTVEVHYIPKHSSESQERLKKDKSQEEESKEAWLKRLRQMFIPGLGSALREEVIEAVKTIYPEMYQRGEKPSLVKAIKTLRERK